jgi:folylpolyglutamate synthase
LVFNCTNGRSGESFLGIALKTINERLQELNTRLKADDFFDRVIFCTNVTYADGHFKGDLTTIAIPEGDLETLKTQRQLKEAWSAHLPNFPTSDILVLPSIEHAVRHIDSLHDGGRPVQVLVSGSLHLIGGMIEAAQISDVAL